MAHVALKATPQKMGLRQEVAARSYATLHALLDTPATMATAGRAQVDTVTRIVQP